MFHSAAVKLTGWYLAIIMALSIGLSVALYNVSSRDLANNLRRQNNYYNFLTPQDLRSLNIQRHNQLEDSQEHLRARLVVFNLAVLLIGGGLSYLLARRTLEPIETALENQSRFAGDAAHELRTPLTAMQTEVEVALRNRKLSKEQAVDQLKSNLEEIAKLRDLSDGLLALVSDRQPADYQAEVVMKKVAAQATKNVTDLAKVRQIKITSNLNDLKVRGNQPQLVNLLTILLDNALKYSPDGSAINLSLKKEDKMARLEVSDQGIGIKPTDIKNIFERFYRADQSRSKAQADGHGLGLAIAKQIVERHRGYIDVKSRSGQGSVFGVSLPLVVK